jgi:hypothetical protein
VTAQAAEAVGAERPAGRLRRDPPAGAQDVAGDSQFVGRGTDVVAGIMQDKVLEMDELTVDPQRGAGISEILAFEEAASDLGTGDALIEPGERDSRCGFYFQISIRGMSYASWVLALNWRRFSANDFSEALCQSDFTIEARRRRARSWTSTGRWRVEWPASWTKSWMAAIRNMLPSNARRLNCGSPPGKSIISWPVTEPIAL